MPDKAKTKSKSPTKSPTKSSSVSKTLASVTSYGLKNQAQEKKNQQIESHSSKAVDFANMLLAKHEANMKRREEEGLYPTPTKSASTKKEKPEPTGSTNVNVGNFAE